MPLRAGQEVLIKNPGDLVGTIVHERPEDKGVPDDQKLYLVEVRRLYYRESDLGVLPEDASPVEGLKQQAATWNALGNAAQKLKQTGDGSEVLALLQELGLVPTSSQAG